MLVLHRFRSDPSSCAYLPGRQSTTEYSVAPVLSPQEYEDLMNGGHRKFGLAFFRPVCETCTECRSIRFAVASFAPDRSQRRCLTRNQDLVVRIGEPVCDPAHLQLFRRYHQVQEAHKHWPAQPTTAEDYYFSFVRNQIPAVEISLWKDEALVGVFLTELTPSVISAVYHYYDPDMAERGLGTYMILKCVELAREMRRQWVYLGYFVKGCASMSYKTRFGHSELLGADGSWRLIEAQPA